MFLAKTAGHESCLVLGDGTVRVSLDLEHPLAIHNLTIIVFDYKA